MSNQSENTEQLVHEAERRIRRWQNAEGVPMDWHWEEGSAKQLNVWLIIQDAINLAVAGSLKKERIDALRYAAQLCYGIGDLHSSPGLQEEHYLDAARLNEEAAKLEETP